MSNLNEQAARKALAYIAAEVGETFLTDDAWTLIRRAAGVDEVTASPAEVIDALGYEWADVRNWQINDGT